MRFLRDHGGWIRACLFSACALLAACDSTTRPDDVKVTLSVSEASPYTRVLVSGLPDAHPAQGSRIQVGQQTYPLYYDPGAASFAFLVPDLPAGPVEVVFPGVAGDEAPSASLTVTTPIFVGGAPEASVDSLSSALDAAAGSITLLQMEIDALRDSVAAARLRQTAEILRSVQQDIVELSGEDQRDFAALYSANKEMFDSLLFLGEETFEALRSPLPQLHAANTPPAAGGMAPSAFLMAAASDEASVETAARLIQECARGLSAINQTATALRLYDNLSLVVATVTAVAPPQVQVAVAGLSVVITGFVDVRMLYLENDAFLVVPGSLTLQVAPGIVKAGSESSTMTARVQRTSVGVSPGSVANLGKSVVEMRLAMKASTGNLQGVLVEMARGFAQEFILQQLIDFVDRLAEEGGFTFVRRPGPVDVEFTGLDIQADAGDDVWRFVSIAESPVRTFLVSEAAGQRDVMLTGSYTEAREQCAITTDATAQKPLVGMNAFRIQETGGHGRIEMDPVRTSATLPQRGAVRPRIRLTNTGSEDIDSLSIRHAFRTPTGEWVEWAGAPAGVHVDARYYQDYLGSGRTMSLDVYISATASAPRGTFSMPVAVFEGENLLAETTIAVTVESQLADIVVRSDTISIGVYDNQAEDGDSVYVELNGKVLAANLEIVHEQRVFPVQLRTDRDNHLIFRALNTGTSGPNTAALTFSNVVRGRSRQSYDQQAGDFAEIVIRVEPEAGSSVLTDRGIPSPLYEQGDLESGRVRTAPQPRLVKTGDES